MGEEALFKRYTDMLIKQWDVLRGEFGLGELHSVYIGGGTPSLFPAGELDRIFDHLGLKSSAIAETTIEVNPESLTEQSLQDYGRLGINRISMGVQSLNRKILESMGRLAGRDDALKAIDMLKEWSGTWSADYIFAYPGQTAESQLEDIRDFLELDPPHLSLYQLTVEEGTALSRSLRKGASRLPDEEEMEISWERCLEVIGEFGYERYEISSFCRDGKYAVHNRVYWQSGRWLGLGAGAASMMDGSRRFTGGPLEKFLVSEEKDLISSGIFYSREDISREDRIGEVIMMGLRTCWGVDREKLITLLEREPEKVFQLSLEKWKGKLLCDQEGLRLNSAGLDWHSAVMVDLLLDLDKFF